MKACTKIVIALTAILLLLLMVACEKTTKPDTDFITIIPDSMNVSSADADWRLGISGSNYSGENRNTYSVYLDYIKSEHDFDSHDNTYLIINGESHRLPLWFDALDGASVHDFGGSVTLYPGIIYDIAFKYNGQLKMSTSIRVPYAPDVTYPDAYNPSAPATVEWTLPFDNQAQQAGISSFYIGLNGGDPTIDRYFPEVDSTTRNVTFPGSCVSPDTTAGHDQTGYIMSVTGYNYRIVNRVMVYLATSDWMDYLVANNKLHPKNSFGRR